MMNKTHDYIHHYRGYWSDGGRCRIRIYRDNGQTPVVICSQLQENDNTSVTNMAEYLAAEVDCERQTLRCHSGRLWPCGIRGSHPCDALGAKGAGPARF